ncbi:MAG: FMN-binding protein [Firmicutes bacterium]|nr:FMN-binding protein [Bacillota bacterium]
MKDMIRYGIILALIAAISGGSISAVVNVTSKVIEERKAEELKAALGALVPEADRFEELFADEKTYYQGFLNNQEAGFVVTGKGDGYGGSIEVLVGFDADGKILNVQIGDNGETPGIGTKVTENDDFIQQFVGKDLNSPIAVGQDIQGVSGASMSSDGVAKAVKNAADFLTMQTSGDDFTLLFPDADLFVPLTVNDIFHYVAEAKGEKLGYVIPGEGQGHGGNIEVSVAFDLDGLILGYNIGKHNETPEIATLVFDNTEFAQQFTSKSFNDALLLGKDINGVASASQTSEGITLAVRAAADKMKDIFVDPSILELLSEADSFETHSLEDTTYYLGLKDDETAGYLIVSQGLGYEGLLNVYVAFDNDGLITGIKLRDHEDTPSMIRMITSDENFNNQFVGKNDESDFTIGKEIQIVSGASYSSEGMVEAVVNATKFFKENIAP